MIDTIDAMADISVTVEGNDLERVDSDTRKLLEEVRSLVDARLARSGAPAPDRAKGVDLAVVSTIVVAVVSSPVLLQLGKALQDWVNRDRHRKLVVRRGDEAVDISGKPTLEELELVKDFFRRELPADPAPPDVDPASPDPVSED